MPIVRDSVLPADRGRRDARRHHERIRGQISDYLQRRIGEEDIITAGPDKRLRVPVKGEKRYRFIFDRGLGGAGQGDGEVGDTFGPRPGEGPAPVPGMEPGDVVYEVEVDLDEVEEVLFQELGLPRLKPRRVLDTSVDDIRFDDVALRGPLLDKKSTLRQNLLRNAKRGAVGLGGIDKDDLRFHSYRDAPQPRTQAVMICLMDSSGSMGDVQKRIARLFYYWTVRFLRHEYTNVEVVFVGHSTEAWELTEQEFFTRRESGGTIVSSAYRKAIEIQRERYPESAWNVYVLHASDGDNLVSDNENVVSLAGELLRVANLVGYLEIGARTVVYGPRLAAVLEEAGLDGVVVARAASEREIWPALKRIFARDNVTEAVAS